MSAHANPLASTVPANARRSILRRWPKPWSINANNRRRSMLASTAGVDRRSTRTNADSTLGLGTNTVAGTEPTTVAVAQKATFTETAP